MGSVHCTAVQGSLGEEPVHDEQMSRLNAVIHLQGSSGEEPVARWAGGQGRGHHSSAHRYIPAQTEGTHLEILNLSFQVSEFYEKTFSSDFMCLLSFYCCNS